MHVTEQNTGTRRPMPRRVMCRLLQKCSASPIPIVVTPTVAPAVAVAVAAMLLCTKEE